MLLISSEEMSCTILATAVWVERLPNTQVLTTTSLPQVSFLPHLSAPLLLDSFRSTQSLWLGFRNFVKQTFYFFKFSYRPCMKYGNQRDSENQREEGSIFTCLICSLNRSLHGMSRLPLKSIMSQLWYQIIT